MSSLEERIGYRFRDASLPKTALSHSSYANEMYHEALKSYERMEFLGDSVLGFVIADYLYSTFPMLQEGELTKLRAEIVCENSLAGVATQLQLGEDLLLGKGEAAGGGRTRVSIIADLVESLIAAIYLDGGFEEAKKFIYRYVLADIQSKVRENADYKTQLQEIVQRQKNQTIVYRLMEETGPDHDKNFEVCVEINGEPFGIGSGKSKKRAEQAAARQAIERHYATEIKFVSK